MLRVISVGIAVSLLLGCGSDDPTEPEGPAQTNCDDVGLCLDEPESGIQVRSEGYLIEPGEDIEYCEVVQLPGEPGDTIYVSGFEVAMTKQSHHLIVNAIEPGTDTDANAQVGDRVPCTGPDVFGGETINATGSQQPYNSRFYPPGVGRTYPGGAKLVFDYHYFNTTSEPVQARAAVNFHTTTADKIERIVQDYAIINIDINTPPGATRVFTSECAFRQDAMVLGLVRHTHQWGQDFNVYHSGGSRDGEHIFLSEDYEDVDHQFDDPVLVKAGEGFRFSCEFVNTETHALNFGLKATNEMCILFADWVVPNVGDSIDQQGCFVQSSEETSGQ